MTTSTTRRPPRASVRLHVGQPRVGAPLGISDEAAARFLDSLRTARAAGLSPAVVLVSEDDLPPEQLAAVASRLETLLTEE